MGERALSFGTVAASYERFRLGYPDAVVDEVVAYAGRPIRTALEIGAGTGKATRVFAARGIEVTASEPDGAMLAELRRHVSGGVATIETTLEQLPAPASHDLVFAAASLHWTEPQHRWSRIAAQLRPGGVFACFGGPVRLADPRVAEAVRAARSPEVADDRVAAPDGTPPDAPVHWPGTELLRSDLFTDVRQVSLPRRTTMTASDYVGQLSTVSAYVVVPAEVREQVLQRVLAVLPHRVAVTADIDLHLARRV